jgi:hypothetical protein
MALVHMVNADPARTPTVAMFARPDYFLSPGSATCAGDGSCVSINTNFAYNHGDYAAEIDTNFLGLAGPGVKHLGLDGSGPADGPSSAGPDSGQITVPNEHTKQLNSSVGELGTDVLIASTKAAESTSPSDVKFKVAQVALRSLNKLRDKVALTIKDDLEAAAFGNQTIRNAGAELGACQAVIGAAKHLAAVG